MEVLVARTHAALDKKDAEEERRRDTRLVEIATAVKLVMEAALKEADRGLTSCRLDFVSHSRLLQPSTLYVGYMDDCSFKNGIAEGMRAYGFTRTGSNEAINNRSTVSVVKFNTPHSKTGGTKGVRITLTWEVPKRKADAPPKNTPSVSNVDLHCPICMEDTPANVLVPCGHHTCKECVAKIDKTDLHPQRCSLCNAVFYKTQLVFADSDRKRKFR